ncbi:hypothetical protein EDE11_1299 [Methylomonas methanica]|uniref:Uncharacterized protein n=1 Tax=Methylomonas methanica TaxID=421 RepID=A0ABY2CHI6_METMH|nr:hypothetical protein EDE11_1299 [Methylomonas methanica]
MENVPSQYVSAKIRMEMENPAVRMLVAILGTEPGTVCTLANIGRVMLPLQRCLAELRGSHSTRL